MLSKEAKDQRRREEVPEMKPGDYGRLVEYRERHPDVDDQIYLSLAKEGDCITRLEKIARTAKYEELNEIRRVAVFISDPPMLHDDRIIGIGWGGGDLNSNKRLFKEKPNGSISVSFVGGYNLDGIFGYRAKRKKLNRDGTFPYEDGTQQVEYCFRDSTPVITEVYEDQPIWELFL